MDPRLVDKRVAARNLNKGLISKEDYDKHIATLPDLADACEEVSERLFGEPEAEDAEETEDTESSEAGEEA